MKSLKMGLLKYFLLPMLFFLELEKLENGAFEVFSLIPMLFFLELEKLENGAFEIFSFTYAFLSRPSTNSKQRWNGQSSRSRRNRTGFNQKHKI